MRGRTEPRLFPAMAKGASSSSALTMMNRSGSYGMLKSDLRVHRPNSKPGKDLLLGRMDDASEFDEIVAMLHRQLDELVPSLS